MRASMIFTGLALTAGLAVASADAHADEKEAETCLRTKIWDGYNDGWAVRTATTTSLAQGEHRIYLVTLYAGNEYQFRVCADAGAADVDLVLHDANGQEVARDKSDDREPSVAFKPAGTDTYYLAVYAAQLAGDAPKAGVAMAVTYK